MNQKSDTLIDRCIQEFFDDPMFIELYHQAMDIHLMDTAMYGELKHHIEFKESLERLEAYIKRQIKLDIKLTKQKLLSLLGE